MSKIHYATGGLITPERAEFSTLCKRKFPQGHSKIMQSGFTGAQNVTCKDCRKLLDYIQLRQSHIEKVKSLISRGEYERIKII